MQSSAIAIPTALVRAAPEQRAAHAKEATIPKRVWPEVILAKRRTEIVMVFRK